MRSLSCFFFFNLIPLFLLSISVSFPIISHFPIHAWYKIQRRDICILSLYKITMRYVFSALLFPYSIICSSTLFPLIVKFFLWMILIHNCLTPYLTFSLLNLLSACIASIPACVRCSLSSNQLFLLSEEKVGFQIFP